MVSISLRTSLVAVGIIATRSALSSVTYNSFCVMVLLNTMLFGLPGSLMRVISRGATPVMSTTTISRSRTLET